MIFEQDRGAASATWPDLGVELRFDLMRLDRRSGDVSAELTAISGCGESAQLLHRARLSLLSTRSRDEVVRHLQQRRADVDWGGLLEAAAWKVVEAQRRGRPALLLRDVEEPPASGWIIEPLLRGDEPTIIFGDGGVAKSYFALALAASMHGGRKLAGLEVARKVRTAYLDWEWHAWPHHRRLRALWGPRELPDLLYVPCQAEGPLSHQVDRLRRILTDHAIEEIVVDSVALACDGPPEEAQSALNFFQALARLEVGALIVAHVNRQGDQDKPFGSAFWHNSARASWYMKRVQEVEGRSLDIGLFQKKSNDGAPSAPVGLHFEFGVPGDEHRVAPGDLRTLISRVDVRDVPELADGVPLKDRIAHLLDQAGPLKVHEIAEQLESKPDSVEKALRRGEGRLFARDIAPDNIARWKRTSSRTAPDKLSEGLPRRPSDTPSPDPTGPEAVRRPESGPKGIPEGVLPA